MTGPRYEEAARAARRLEGVEIVKHIEGEDPWLILRVDGRLTAVPARVTTASQLVDFVCRTRNIVLMAGFEDTAKHQLIDTAQQG